MCSKPQIMTRAVNVFKTTDNDKGDSPQKRMREIDLVVPAT